MDFKNNICFKKVDYDLSGLLHYIDIGDIGLPDIQRPFVWPNTKVRDLFDSMFNPIEAKFEVADAAIKNDPEWIANISDLWAHYTTSYTELESFCYNSYMPPKPGGPPSSYNYFIKPHPGELLRVSVAIGFYRGKLRSVYQILRGKDPDTGEYTSDRREQQFATLKQAQQEMLSLTSWHRFFTSLVGAGFRGSEMINSNVTLLYTYAFYLIGRNRFKVQDFVLERLIARWYIAITLTSRYIGSFESAVDSDLRKVREAKTTAEFCEALEHIINGLITPDFWEITLPGLLESSSAVNPQYFTYLAAQNKLNAPLLFSTRRISELLDPMLHSTKKPLEKHHLFPRAWLERNGVTEISQINQVANFALLEWPDNLEISDDSPALYVKTLKSRFREEDWITMTNMHALPLGWENMEYFEFLTKRRFLMAGIIRKSFELL